MEPTTVLPIVTISQAQGRKKKGTMELSYAPQKIFWFFHKPATKLITLENFDDNHSYSYSVIPNKSAEHVKRINHNLRTNVPAAEAL
jgi:hypothetical protein